MSLDLVLPPQLQTDDHRERRVGVEIEFAGLEVAEVAKMLCDLFNARSVRLSDYEYEIEHDHWGKFRVEVDSSFLRRTERNGPRDSIERLGHMLAASVVGSLVPIEIALPPIPLSELGAIDCLGPALHELGARGTTGSWLYAFGIHFNPELATLSAEYILRHLRAFLLLSDWLVVALDVDTSRRLTSFIDPFPRNYIDAVLEPGYAPDRETFIADYLRANPTRNRGLDLLPLCAHIAPEVVAEALGPDSGVKPRPTWHYRLPNSLIGRGKRPLRDWWSWVLVEQLAADQVMLQRALQSWRESPPGALTSLFDPSWERRMDGLLRQGKLLQGRR